MPEVYFPGSTAPFRPLNAHGRAMPRVPQRERPQLWQVVVWDRRKKHEVPIGPRMQREFVDSFFEVISNALKCGAEKDWTNPHIVKVKSERRGDSRTLRDLLMENGHAS